MTTFPPTISRAAKRDRGKTGGDETPLVVRSRIPLPEGTAAKVRQVVARALGGTSTRIEKVTVRFDDVNGPRGGVDTLCRIKVVVSGAKSVLVEERSATPLEAVSRAVPRLERSLRRVIKRRGGKAPSPTGKRRGRGVAKPHAAGPSAGLEEGSFIGRRVGRAESNLEAALARPEKQRRDAYVDTAAPGVSASDRRAGGMSTARRNSKRSQAGMTATLEDSRTRPSRKSGRKSANRAKAGTVLTKRTRSRTSSAQSRHRRGK